MVVNNFIWADLSSYNPTKTKTFYEAVFGWKYYNIDNYFTAYLGPKEIVGLYETPLAFQKMKMPSFWMSYIQVSDVESTVEKARELGGIIELVEIDASIGNIALIRDTLGAGFTVYDGNAFNSRTKNEENTFIFNELHISDATKAISFYKALFDWEFTEISSNSFAVYNSQNEHIATINEIPNSIKSTYEYWICVFGVKDVQKTLKTIEKHNGTMVFDEGERLLCSDGSEAFFYIQNI
ncbi:VOC family protein [Tenacibaculum amylolyticum]|uniref:VOC family protein n=1 Tax=Tenacibaculum amylolyticum TaxID=104269 RepID=UPI003895C418